jgi:hypothetical protein
MQALNFNPAYFYTLISFSSPNSAHFLFMFLISTGLHPDISTSMKMNDTHVISVNLFGTETR